jgi:hypothetical protein
MVGGGAVAGYFIGRSAKHRPRNAASAFGPRPARAIDTDTLRVTIRLRALPPEPQKFDRVYSRLFTGDANANPAR